MMVTAKPEMTYHGSGTFKDYTVTMLKTSVTTLYTFLGKSGNLEHILLSLKPLVDVEFKTDQSQVNFIREAKHRLLAISDQLKCLLDLTYSDLTIDGKFDFVGMKAVRVHTFIVEKEEISLSFAFSNMDEGAPCLDGIVFSRFLKDLQAASDLDANECKAWLELIKAAIPGGR